MKKSDETKKEPLTVEKVREIAVSRLKGFVRHLEKAGLLPTERASKLIGDVVRLEKMATGEFKLKK